MAYSLYRLEFSTGLHIGQDTGGSSLDDSRMTIHSDTLFSALCCECGDNTHIDQLYKYFSTGVLAISDALPYKGEEYYLPKPILFRGKPSIEGEPGFAKALKSLEYIPLSRFNEYLQGVSGQILEELKADFGAVATYERVAIKGLPQPSPYYVACWRFSRDAGLYIIVQYNTEQALGFFESILKAVGVSGIGGKRSSGLGKYRILKTTVPNELAKLLDDSGANYQMLMGTALPNDTELDDALSDSWYMTIRRGGFVQSQTYSNQPLKKRTIHLLAPGSCLKSRFTGDIFDVSAGGSHRVWRMGKSLFAGVRV